MEDGFSHSLVAEMEEVVISLVKSNAKRYVRAARRVLAYLGMILSLACFAACGPRYTDADLKGELAAESMLSRIHDLDAGVQANTYSRAGLCAIQNSLSRHDAGRLVSSVECIPKREP